MNKEFGTDNLDFKNFKLSDFSINSAFIANQFAEQQREQQKIFDKIAEQNQIRVIKAFVKETQQVHAFAKVAKQNKDYEKDSSCIWMKKKL